MVALTVPAWLTRGYEVGPDGSDPDIIFKMMQQFNGMFYDGKFAEADELLGSLRIEDLPLVLVNGIVRFCFGARDKLPHWVELKERFICEMNRQGKQASFAR